METLREGMMNRIGWFTHLRLVFDNTANNSVSRDSVIKADFLADLVDAQNVFFVSKITKFKKEFAVEISKRVYEKYKRNWFLTCTNLRNYFNDKWN